MHIRTRKAITINAPARNVWQVLAHEFDHIGLWASGVVESYASSKADSADESIRTGRICRIKGDGGALEEVREEFLYYDDEGMRFGYSAQDKPLFMESAESHWSVTERSANSCVVNADARIVTKLSLSNLFPTVLMYVMLPVMARHTLQELKHYVEHGAPHPRKVRAARNANASLSRP